MDLIKSYQFTTILWNSQIGILHYEKKKKKIADYGGLNMDVVKFYYVPNFIDR